jgi:hypothetical protein
LDSSASLSVATTWLLHFEPVEKILKASADILRVSAFLNPDNIPLEPITQGAKELGDPISTALPDIETNPLILDELLLPLCQTCSCTYKHQNIYPVCYHIITGSCQNIIISSPK